MFLWVRSTCRIVVSLARLAGIEPAAYGLGNRLDSNATDDQPTTCDTSQKNGASIRALSPQHQPKLELVIEAWPELPVAIRAAIVAMISATP